MHTNSIDEIAASAAPNPRSVIKRAALAAGLLAAAATFGAIAINPATGFAKPTTEWDVVATPFSGALHVYLEPIQK